MDSRASLGKLRRSDLVTRARHGLLLNDRLQRRCSTDKEVAFCTVRALIYRSLVFDAGLFVAAEAPEKVGAGRVEEVVHLQISLRSTSCTRPDPDR